MRLGAFLLGVALVGPAWPQTGAGSEKEWRIEGQVLDSVTGAPIRKVLVTLDLRERRDDKMRQPLERLGVLTDAGGRFVFSGTVPGSYALQLEHPGYRFRTIPAQGSTEKLIAVGPGAHISDLAVRLTPWGVLTGRILDQDGDPVPNVEVEMLRFGYTSRGRELRSRHSGTSDDTGHYRISRVFPGRYFLRAVPQRSGWGQGLVRILNSPGANIRTFYPSSIDLQGSSPVEIGPGQQLDGVDIALRRGTVASVRGRVILPGLASEFIVFVTERVGNEAMNAWRSVGDREGRFEVHNLPPGAYVISAQIDQGNTRMVAEMPVQIAGVNIEGLELHPRPAFAVRGRLRFEGDAPFPSQPFGIDLRDEDDEIAGYARPAIDSPEFVVRDVFPGSYFVAAYPPGGFVKSVRLGDSDYLDKPLDLTAGPPAEPLVIVLSTNVAKVEGTVDLAGKPLPAATQAVLIPAAAHSRRAMTLMRQAIVKPDGRFELTNVAPGSYRVYAWTYGDIHAALFDPDYLKPYLSYGADVTAGEGGNASVAVKLIPRLEEE